MPATVELTIRRLPDASLVTELRAELPRSRADLGSAPITISIEALLALTTSSEVYGATLTAMALPQALHPAWQRTRGYTEGADQGLHVRVLLNDPTGALHALRWELLRDPLTNAPLAQQEGGSLARQIILDDLHERVQPAKPALRALVAVSGPSDLGQHKLAPVDTPAEAARALTALGPIEADLLAEGHERSTGRATLVNLRDGLRARPHILYLICHGQTTEAGSTFYLESADGKTAPIKGVDLADEIKALDVAHRPLLAVLVACEGGSQEDGPLAAIGPLLARAGIPAVVAMQAKVTIPAAAKFTARMLRELAREGRIDQALAAARKEMGDEWWTPVLWLCSRDGRLWKEEGATPTKQKQLRALLHDHSGFIASRLEAFVGREKDLAEIRARIAALRGTGGYVTVTGHAGQGKSSIIARLLQDYDPKTTAHHFIPIKPGPDHQVSLMRNLLAQLILKHGLSEIYVASDSRPALRDYFAQALREIAAMGRQEIIVIDGLDQIEDDVTGERDLSFLPLEPPPGIVFLLGTRPNDALKPLELRKPHTEYWLPNLSRHDFVLILAHRGVTSLDVALTERFYQAMQENALYLDLVALELAQPEALEPERLIVSIADDPDNLFSLSVERLRRDRQRWRTVLKPILGLLLAARDPVSRRALRTLIGVEDDECGEGILRLGGLLARDGEGRYYLYHLKLADFLRQDPANPQRAYVFVADEEEGYHQRLADWCAGNKGGLKTIWEPAPGDALERERRAYAQQHYIAHLAAARAYPQLWEIIDTGEYGQAKRRHDPSTRSYALDLDIARGAVITETAGYTDAQAKALPRLWRYSLLRCSLTSQADNYPEELFLALVALGRSSEAINLAELLSDPAKKTNTLQAIGTTLLARGSNEGIDTLQRARATADAIPDDWGRASALSALAQALASGQRWDDARATADAISDNSSRAEALSALAQALASGQRWDDARATADAIPEDRFGSRARALSALAQALAFAQHPLATPTFTDARTTADAIPDDWGRAEALSALAQALASVQRWDDARATADAISDNSSRAEALSALAQALASAQHPLATPTFTDARATADAFPDDWRRAEALSTLAQVLASAQHPLATPTFIDARATADAIPGDIFGSRAEALSALAQALASAQRWDDARDTADAIPDDRGRATALSAVAQALASAQRWDDARATADAIPGDIFGSRAEALSALAQALASAQHPLATPTFIDARATADAIPDDRFGSRAEALSALVQALASTQRWDDARATADAIPGDWRRTTALSALVQALASAQHPLATPTFTDARATADAIPDDRGRARALSALAQALASAQRWDDARATADAIPDDRFGSRAEALSALAQALASAQHPLATPTFTDAHATADAIPDNSSRAEVLSALAQALASTQRWDDARATANAIPEHWVRAEALSALAQALASAQHPLATPTFIDARATADAIPDDWVRAEALSALAQALASVQHPLATPTFIDARTTADAIPEDGFGSRARALSTLAQALASAQRWDDARATADAIPEDRFGSRARALSALAQALAFAQHPLATSIFTDARATAVVIPENNSRAEALSALVQALASAQRWDDARATIDAIPEDWGRARALSALAQALASAQRWDDARVTADAIPFNNSRAEALSTLAQALASAQRWDDARATAVIIPDNNSRAEALSTLAQALASAQHPLATPTFTDARTTADAIPEDWGRARALSALAQALASAQRWDDARATADAIPEDGFGSRATALSAIAQIGSLQWATALIVDVWHRAQTRNELLALFSISAALIHTYPELGKDFLTSFDWVDIQLTAG